MKSVPECHFVVGIVAMETWKCDTWNSYQNLNNLYYFSVYMYMIWKTFITELNTGISFIDMYIIYTIPISFVVMPASSYLLWLGYEHIYWLHTNNSWK